MVGDKNLPKRKISDKPTKIGCKTAHIVIKLISNFFHKRQPTLRIFKLRYRQT